MYTIYNKKLLIYFNVSFVKNIQHVFMYITSKIFKVPFTCQVLGVKTTRC